MHPLDDADIGAWVMNDEGLYNWWRSTGLTPDEFIAENRAKLTEVIDNVRSGRRKAHYLAYPDGRDYR